MSVIVLGAFVPVSASALSVSEQVASLLEQIRSLQTQIASLRSQAIALRVSTSTSPTPPSTPVGCVIPPIPVGSSTPSTYHDGKVKIVSTAHSYVYKDGKRQITITPNSYVEKDGDRQVTITRRSRIDKDGKHKTSISCTGTSADAIAPVLSLVGATLTDTSASIAWTTNENATGRVYFSTSSPVGIATAPNVATAVRSISHSLILTGLSASTTYFYVIESKDAAGNTATSSEQHFTTLATPDTVPPTISSVSVGSIASTSAQVAWTTNEAATSKAYFGTTTPLATTSAATVAGSVFLTAHSLALSGLSTSTTYYVIVESKDGVGNTATSNQISFVTGN